MQGGGRRGRRDRRGCDAVRRWWGTVVPRRGADEQGGVLRLLRGGGARHDGRSVVRALVGRAEGQSGGGDHQMTTVSGRAFLLLVVAVM